MKTSQKNTPPQLKKDEAQQDKKTTQTDPENKAGARPGLVEQDETEATGQDETQITNRDESIINGNLDKNQKAGKGISQRQSADEEPENLTDKDEVQDFEQQQNPDRTL